MTRTRICEKCGKGFEPRSGSQKYCSPKCARDSSTEKNIGNIRRRSKIQSKINPKILAAYGYKCAICGWSLTPSFLAKKYLWSHGCEQHHIVPVAEGGTNEESNIILLCPNCHKMAHYGYLTKDELRQHALTKDEVEKRERKWTEDVLLSDEMTNILENLYQ